MFKTLLYLTASLLPLITARNIGFVDNGRGQVFLFKGGPTDWKRDANATLWAARPEMKDWDKDDRISVEETVKNEQERYGWSPWYLPKAKEGQSSEVKALYIDVDKDGRIKTPSGEYTFQIRYRNEKYGTLSGMVCLLSFPLPKVLQAQMKGKVCSRTVRCQRQAVARGGRQYTPLWFPSLESRGRQNQYSTKNQDDGARLP